MIEHRTVINTMSDYIGKTTNPDLLGWFMQPDAQKCPCKNANAVQVKCIGPKALLQTDKPKICECPTQPCTDQTPGHTHCTGCGGTGFVKCRTCGGSGTTPLETRWLKKSYKRELEKIGLKDIEPGTREAAEQYLKKVEPQVHYKAIWDSVTN